MPETGFTLEGLTALNEAIITGTRRVRYADKEVEYRTLAEMLALRDVMRRELGLVKGTVRVYPNHSKNL